MGTAVSIDEFRQILALTPSEQNILLVGKHGIGKSEVITNYFTSEGLEVVTLFLGQMNDPGDLIGLPYKNQENMRTEFLPPYWFPTENKPIVLFLDELNRARPEILQAIMDLTLNRTLMGRKIPDGSRLISSVNHGEVYQLTELDPALVSRFNIYEFKPSVDEWLVWAQQNKIDQRIIHFIKMNQNFLEGDVEDHEELEKIPDRRAWKRVSDIIVGKDVLSDIYAKLLSGIIGVKPTNLFIKYSQSLKVLSGQDILLNFDTHKDKLSALKIHELVQLNESIFKFIESYNQQNNHHKDIICESLMRYIDYLEYSKLPEVFAHLISLYSSACYPKTVAFISINCPQLYKKIQIFISKL